jgi:asparagine synthase (glutamine-hydrolysing)
LSLAASIECRAPLMVLELVELSTRFPWELKVMGFTMKYLLKKAVEPWLPAEILNRKKRGFGAPVGAWFKQDLGGLVREMLSVERLKRRGFFRPEAVQKIIADHETNRADYTDGLLALVCFETWCELYLDGADRQYATSMTTATSLGG